LVDDHIETRASDFYCDEVFSGRTPVERVVETDDVLAFQHTRPFYEIHVVVVPKRHIASLLDPDLRSDELLRLLDVVRTVSRQVLARAGACRVITNLGDYQDSKHLHWHVVSGAPLKHDSRAG
jgi:histidine triad (HIT) family protein